VAPAAAAAAGGRGALAPTPTLLLLLLLLYALVASSGRVSVKTTGAHAGAAAGWWAVMPIASACAVDIMC
jgi:hypothetical protein